MDSLFQIDLSWEKWFVIWFFNQNVFLLFVHRSKLVCSDWFRLLFTFLFKINFGKPCWVLLQCNWVSRLVSINPDILYLSIYLSIYIYIYIYVDRYIIREACNFIKKENLAQVFSCEFCEISKNIFFKEHPWTNASTLILKCLLLISSMFWGFFI